MEATRFVVAVVVLLGVVGGVGVSPAAATDENPACNSPSQGFSRSVEGSDGTSLEHAGPGIITARTKIGCENPFPS